MVQFKDVKILVLYLASLLCDVVGGGTMEESTYPPYLCYGEPASAIDLYPVEDDVSCAVAREPNEGEEAGEESEEQPIDP